MKIALCKKSKEVPKEGWAFEIKEDGLRIVAVDRRLYLREEDHLGRDVTDKFPDVRPPENYALDGEMVGKSVGSLTGRVNCSDDFRIEMKARMNPATYKVFDLIMVGGTDYRNRPYVERRRVLNYQEEVRNAKGVEIVPYYDDGDELLRRTREKGLEGVVAKKKDSKYPEGRSRNWLKIKNFDSEIFPVVDYGYTEDGGFVILIELEGGDTQKIVVNEGKEQEKIKNADLEGLRAEVRFLQKTDSNRLRHIAYEGIVGGEKS